MPSISFGNTVIRKENRKWQKKRKSCDKDDILLESLLHYFYIIWNILLEEQKKSIKEDYRYFFEISSFKIKKDKRHYNI